MRGRWINRAATAPFTDLLKTSKGNGEARAPTPAKPTPEPKPGEGAKVVPAPGNGQIDKDWASTPEGIEHAAKTFGMERLPFETDEALAQRVNARRALG
jgi:hypothetical protein